MYHCENCGARAAGNFCSQCGQRVAQPPAEPQPPAAFDWERCGDAEALLRVPELRDRVKRHAEMAGKGTTGEQWLDSFGKLAGVPLPFSALVGVVQPFYAKLGVGTGKARAETLPAPVGRVLVRLLCALARTGRNVVGVERLPAGSVLVAELPSDLFAFKGELHARAEAAGDGTRVELGTRIPGQFFDWGKSRRCLDELFGELRRDPV